ncbi:hypothetical protein [Ereboglobus sp. PH5-5]|uniref:hypothetical protein n=1 Tax=Ereboglobus sp. PH5-5 TaxID=2940529 RepID=UPI002404CB83|nr:hypothetical protein [Ereboglobus sp. PH5-5]
MSVAILKFLSGLYSLGTPFSKSLSITFFAKAAGAASKNEARINRGIFFERDVIEENSKAGGNWEKDDFSPRGIKCFSIRTRLDANGWETHI